MKKTLPFVVLFISFIAISQNTTNQILGEIIQKVSEETQGEDGRWQFVIEERTFLCLTDQNNNRMRIMTPITEVENLSEEDLKNALTANFHTTLDVKYAISNEILWSVFIHPLKELTENQIIDAISQVFYAAETFGTIYSSTNLIFPGNTQNKELDEVETKNTKVLKLQKG